MSSESTRKRKMSETDAVENEPSAKVIRINPDAEVEHVLASIVDRVAETSVGSSPEEDDEDIERRRRELDDEARRRESSGGGVTFGRMGRTESEQKQHIQRLLEVEATAAKASTSDADVPVPQGSFVKLIISSVASGTSIYYVPVYAQIRQCASEWQLTQALLARKSVGGDGEDASAITIAIDDVDDEHSVPEYVRAISKEDPDFLAFDLTAASDSDRSVLSVTGTLLVQA